MSHPPGWYADPQSPPGYAPGVRWWDGQRWTDAAYPAVQPPGPTSPGPTSPGPVAGGPAASGPSTPDGEPLAGWGVRFGAYLIDAVLVSVVAAIIGAPFVAKIVNAYADLFRDTIRAAETGSARPDQMDVYGEIWLPLLGFALVSIVLNFIYQVGFLRWRGATPGKLALGLRVRLRERPGPLEWETILRRWVSQFGPNLLTLVPVLGLVAGVYPWVDGLWPLWDERRQALHDKFAQTNVVRTRRPG
jgi:uncharacterized RDD family membrane protein YckC